MRQLGCLDYTPISWRKKISKKASQGKQDGSELTSKKINKYNK